MRTKDFLKLFIPPILSKIKHCFDKKETAIPLRKISPPKQMILLGSGPSLNKTFEQYYETLKEKNLMVCNYFATTKYYEELKPKYYVVADPMFISPTDKTKDAVDNFKRQIVEKTTWPIIFLMPISGIQSELCEYFKRNSNIKISFYNNTVYEKFENISKNEAWDRNIIPPPMQSVMNVALFISLYWGCSETYLIGVDTNLLEDIRIDQKTNVLFSLDRHFYGNKETYKNDKYYNDKTGHLLTDWKLHEFIFAVGKMLEGYSDLKEYADYKGLKVYNASEYSWINCFERKKLDE